MASFPGQKGTAAPLPNQVQGLTATPISAGEVDLAWTAVPGASSYNVYRGGALSGVLIGSSLVPSYADLTVAASSTYTYAVTAVNGNGEGLRSAPASALTFPAQVTGLVATPVSSSEIDLSWSSTPGATSYRVFRNASLVGSPAGASFNDTGLAPSTTYTYTVAAANASGVGAQSAAVNATTQASGVAVTKYVRASGVSPDGKPTFTTWQAAINSYVLNDVIEHLPDTFGVPQTVNSGAAPVMNFGAVDFTGGGSGKLTCRFRAGETFRLTCANSVTIQAAGAKGFEINFNGAGGVPATVKIGDSDLTWSQAHPLLTNASPQHQILFTNGTNHFRLIGNSQSVIYGSSQYSCNQIDSSCHHYYCKSVYFFLGGTNNNTTGSGALVLCDLVDFEGDTVLMVDCHANLGGHDAMSMQATHCIMDSCSLGQNWVPQNTGFAGARCSSLDPNILVTGSGGHLKTSGPWGYVLAHNCNWNDGGPWQPNVGVVVNGSKLDGLHVICRGGFWADITQSHPISLQYFGGDGSATGSNGAQSCSYVKMYNNTMINCAGALRVQDVLEKPTTQIVAPTDMEGFGFQNNLLMRTIDTAQPAFSSLILYQLGGGFGPPQGATPLNGAAGNMWRNSFKGARIEGNCVSFNTASATAKELTLQGTGGGAAQIDTPLAGWVSVDPGSGHPNVSNNVIVTEGAGPNRLDLINAGTAPGRSRTGVAPANTSTIGLGDRPPLCKVTQSSSGNSVAVDDAGFFVAGWLPIDSFFPEYAGYNDIVFIGNTAATAVAFQLSSISYNPGLSGHLIGTTNITVTAGMGVWPGGFDGRRPWSDVGAIQA